MQCAETGLIDGKRIFIDSSLIDANASNSSIVDTYSLKSHLNEQYQDFDNIKRKDCLDYGARIIAPA